MKLLMLFGLSCSLIISFAQKNETGIIRGNVITSDGKAAESVSILFKNTTRGTITDETGNFEFRKIRPGKHVLVLSLSGFSQKEINVEVKEDDTTFIIVQLQQTYVELQNIIIESNVNTISETRASATRLNVPLIEIAQNIVTISHQLLNEQGLLSMSEVIRNVSGIQKNYGGLNDITMNIRGVEGPYNVLRNGIGGYWWNQQEDVAMIERIEFIKGPAGFIQSDLPPGGFVNVITKQPIKEKVTTVNAEFGSYNLIRLSTDIGGPFSKSSKFSYRFNAGIHRQDRAFKFSDASRHFICGALKFEPDKKNSITAEYNYTWGKSSGNNDGLPSINGKMFSLPRNFAVADAKTDQIIASDNYFRLQARHNFNEHWNLNFLLGYINGVWGGEHMLDADEEHPVSNDTLYRYANFDLLHNHSKVVQLYLNGSFYTGTGMEHKVLAALDYNNYGYTDKGGTGQDFGLYIPHPDYYVNSDSLKYFTDNSFDTSQLKKISFFLEDHIKINDRLIVTLAGRLSHDNVFYVSRPTSDFEQKALYDQFTPRFGITWLFSNTLSAYALHDNYFMTLQAKNHKNKIFDPITGSNTEFGMKAFFLEQKLNLNFSIYHIVANNTIMPDPIYQNNYVQTGQVISKGIEFDMTGRISRTMSVNTNYTFINAKITKGDSAFVGQKLIGTPDHSFNLWLHYKLVSGKFKNLGLGFGYQYMGRRSAFHFGDLAIGNSYLPIYHLLDASINYRKAKFNIGLNIYNITNIHYATLGYFNVSANEWRYTPGEPINFRLSFGVNLRSFSKNKI
jgi:iron complex outermembrane receptor protein